MTDDRGKITGHFVMHWGVPKEIYPRVVNGVGEIAILEFPPRMERHTWRYATNGMSSYVQSFSGRCEIRTELYASARKSESWIVDLLSAIVSYPRDYDTYLAEGDTIDVGQPIDRQNSIYHGILLAAPGPKEPAGLGLIAASNTILVHQVIGLLKSEIIYAKTEKEHNLREFLVQHGKFLLDEERESFL